MKSYYYLLFPLGLVITSAQGDFEKTDWNMGQDFL